MTRPISCPSPVIVGTNVFKTLGRNCRAHLGLNFLSNLQVSSLIRVCFQKAAFQEKLGDPATGKVGKVRCRLRHPLTVKPSKVIEVTGSLCSSLPQGKHSVLIQELEDPNPHGLTVINTMHEVFGKKGRVKVLLANSSERPITLHNRQVIVEAYTPLWSSPLSQVCANIKGLVSDNVQVDPNWTNWMAFLPNMILITVVHMGWNTSSNSLTRLPGILGLGQFPRVCMRKLASSSRSCLTQSSFDPQRVHIVPLCAS